MRVANDKSGNRIFADSGEKYKDCYCPVCGELLTHRVGAHNIPHFAHKAKSECAYGNDKDSKSPWHRHMQDLFPPDSIEVRFFDKQTGKVRHIADVFLESANTVIEFQHSTIQPQDFIDRTMFHISEGRRIVWVFDESKDGAEFGRLRRCDYSISDFIHRQFDFEWPRSPRKVLYTFINNPGADQYDDYSICVYYGTEGDVVHRIISHTEEYHEVTLSVNSISVDNKIDPEDFFKREEYWLAQSPWKEMIEERQKRINMRSSNKKQYTLLPSRRGSGRKHRRF